MANENVFSLSSDMRSLSFIIVGNGVHDAGEDNITKLVIVAITERSNNRANLLGMGRLIGERSVSEDSARQKHLFHR